MSGLISGTNEVWQPVAIRRGKFWDVFRDGERYTRAELRVEIKRVHANIEQRGREAGKVITAARRSAGLSMKNLARLAGARGGVVQRLERQGTPALAARELLCEAYGVLLPASIELLTKPFDPRAVGAGLHRARRGRSFEEIEAIVAVDRRFIAGLESPEAWGGDVAFVGQLLVALKRAGAKPIAPFASLSEWYWERQQFQ